MIHDTVILTIITCHKVYLFMAILMLILIQNIHKTILICTYKDYKKLYSMSSYKIICNFWVWKIVFVYLLKLFYVFNNIQLLLEN